MEYLQKIENESYESLLWNIPEQKQGLINIIGGNSQNFRTSVKIAEHLTDNFPIKTANLILPDSLKSKLPPLDNFVFLSSTDTGSFKSDEELLTAIDSADYVLLIGDLSKNSITSRAVYLACEKTEKPLLITRDAVDLIAEEATEKLMMNENLIFFSTLPQLVKLFRAIYYPKMITISQPLLQVAEALHKFTLSYPAQIITFTSGQFLIAKNGRVNVIPLEKTTFTALSIWQGELAADIAAFNFYNPNNFLDATSAAILSSRDLRPAER